MPQSCLPSCSIKGCATTAVCATTVAYQLVHQYFDIAEDHSCSLQWWKAFRHMLLTSAGTGTRRCELLRRTPWSYMCIKETVLQ